MFLWVVRVIISWYYRRRHDSVRHYVPFRRACSDNSQLDPTSLFALSAAVSHQRPVIIAGALGQDLIRSPTRLEITEEYATVHRWRRQKVSFRGAIAQRSGRRKSPNRIERRSAGRGSGIRSPQKLKQFANIVYRFWLQKRQKFEHSAQFASWFLTRFFTLGAKGYFRGLSPLFHAWRRLSVFSLRVYF